METPENSILESLNLDDSDLDIKIIQAIEKFQQELKSYKANNTNSDIKDACAILLNAQFSRKIKDEIKRYEELHKKISNYIPNEDHALNPLTIYGEDNRVDIFNKNNDNLAQRINDTREPGSTTPLIPSNTFNFDTLIKNSNKVCYITTDNNFEPINAAEKLYAPVSYRLRDSSHLDQLLKDRDQNPNGYAPAWTIPFLTQPSINGATGFLLTPSILLTTGHTVALDKNQLINKVLLNRLTVIRKYRMEQLGEFKKLFSHLALAKVRKILAFRYDSTYDFALLQLDRDMVSPDEFVPYSAFTGAPLKDQKAYIIGHPRGLPQKLTFHASIGDCWDGTQYSINSDTFGGNSGSPIFDERTHQLIGLFTKGKSDYCANPASPYLINNSYKNRSETEKEKEFFLPISSLPDIMNHL